MTGIFRGWICCSCRVPMQPQAGPATLLTRTAARAPDRAARPRSRTGATLVEMMLGMAVVGTACLAAMSGLLMSLRIADSTLLALTATSSVRSISEQILAVDYLALFTETLSVDVPSRPNGTLVVNAWNERTEDFRHTPDNPRDDLRLRIRPAITRVLGQDGLDYAQVVIQYEWSDSTFFGRRTRSDRLTMLVAPVSAF